MPVLNVEGTIGRALESVVSQSIPPTEILVIDGLSSDATLERVAAYRKHLTAVISEPDKGLFDAINKGLRLATGDVVAILNGDDFYAHNMIFDAYCKKFRDPEVGIVFADVEFFAEGAPDRTIRRYSSRRFNPTMLPNGWMPPHPTVFARRSVYEQVGEYSLEYKIAADFEFLVRAMLVHEVPFKRLDSVVVKMQYGGVSTAGPKATFALNREIIAACRANGYETNWLRILAKLPRKLIEFAPVLRRRRPSRD